MNKRVEALKKLLERWADREVGRAVNQQELDRAERAKQYWLANGLIKRPQ